MKSIYYIFLFGVFISCKQPKESHSNQDISGEVTEFIAPIFKGKIVLEASITSEDTNDIRLFNEYSPTKIEIYFDAPKFRLKEYGGLSKGNLIIDNKSNQVFQLDSINNIAYEGIFSDFDNATETVKRQMPDHYKPTFEKLNETEIIQGYACTKYKILRSGFLRPDTETYVWATNAFKFPPSRFDIQTDINLVSVPMPLLIGFDQGTILKMLILDKIGQVKFEVIEIDTTVIQKEIFEIPNGYVIQ